MYFFLNPGLTGLEPATSAVTGRCSNQLNYKPTQIAILMMPEQLKICNKKN